MGGGQLPWGSCPFLRRINGQKRGDAEAEINYEEESVIKTRFYFDHNKIAYIKTVIDDSEEEILKVNFSDEVNESLFEIPDDYAEI